MTDTALRDSVRLVVRPRPDDAEILTEITRLKSEGWVSDQVNALLETTTWTLTEDGRHAAAQLQ